MNYSQLCQSTEELEQFCLESVTDAIIIDATIEYTLPGVFTFLTYVGLVFVIVFMLVFIFYLLFQKTKK